ncbi:GntR family transcriptional regulator [Terriglobus sp. ADX1]|uniref:GntR family transcriptional regulator n=1 Tax=Terriglobus sp. ADX1 TaxID=2794063 RepID=UPI002FE5B1A6
MPRRSKTHHPGPKPSVRMKAYQLIQQKIATGELRAGELLSELALSRELGSSRTPIREAAGQLLAEGLLELSPGGGLIVTQLTRQAIVDLYELREALEVFAVGRAAQNGVRPADKERLESLLAETQVLIKELKTSGSAELNAEQMKRFSVSDLGFHSLLIRIASNARILKVVNDTRLMMRIFAIQRSGHRRDELERIQRHHRAILQAVLQSNPDEARRLLAEHIQASASERLDQFDRWERENHLAALESATPYAM